MVFRKASRPSVQLSEHETNDSRSTFSWPRLILPPLKRKGHVILDFCDKEGQFSRTNISKSSPKPLYNDARKCSLGDLWPHKIQGKIIDRNVISRKEDD